MSLTESEIDYRNKIVRFTDLGREYAKNIIPPAANAEIDAMAELAEEDIIELVRILTQEDGQIPSSIIQNGC